MTRLMHLACLIAMSGVTASASLQQVADLPILSVRTDLVTLSVTVVDRRGAPVTGLRQEHFSIYDNDEPRMVQFFTSEAVPATIGLLIDSSTSMRGRRDDVLAAAAAFAETHHPLDEFFTLNFNEAVWPGLPPHITFTSDPNQLRAALYAAPARGMTALYDALDRGLAHLERGTWNRKALIVVSDGGDNASAHSLAAVLEHARQSDVVIYAVTLANADDRDARPQVLKRLASEAGGRAFAPASPDEVKRAFAQIAWEISSAYSIGFAPSEAARGGFRAIRVVADVGDHRRLTVRTRAGYYVEPSGETAR